MKLELGAGYRPTDGFVHNDINPGEDIEIVGPAEMICELVGEEKCEEIRATHLLEHFSFTETTNVLREWKRALVPGGLLYIEVPNLAWQTRAHANGEIDDEQAVYYIYGEQDYEGNFHYAAFTPALLGKRLREAGFENVRTTDIGQVVTATAFRPDGDGAGGSGDPEQ